MAATKGCIGGADHRSNDLNDIRALRSAKGICTDMYMKKLETATAKSSITPEKPFLILDIGCIVSYQGS